MDRHDSSQTPTGRRALIALATAGVALGAGAPTAAAAGDHGADVPSRLASLGKVDPQAGVQALTGSARYVTGSVRDLRPNPLAGTAVDPLANGVETQIADFKPVTSRALTAPVAQARSIGSVSVAGQAMGLLGG